LRFEAELDAGLDALAVAHGGEVEIAERGQHRFIGAVGEGIEQVSGPVRAGQGGLAFAQLDFFTGGLEGGVGPAQTGGMGGKSL
jgi:hypothetical protein